ncbi:MAG: hypothetical protein P8N11_08580 [Gammaproteobacteria bacterium]|nr:hypothetical protein [Gammaproteobacteria bacterium]
MNNTIVRNMSSFLVAVIAAYLLGAIFISQGNIASVIALNFDVSLAQRFEAALHDVTNMTGIYLPVIAASYLLAMPVATFIIKYLPQHRMILYIAAGAAGLITIHIIMKLLFGISGIAATRSVIGMLAQAVAGGVGGHLFHLISIKPADSE